MIRALAIFSLLLLSAPLAAKETRRLEAKAETLGYLREMRFNNVKRLKEIDDTMRARLEDSPAMNVEFEISRLKVAKQEHVLRQEFLDRLILQVDTKFAGGDLRLFLERALTEMSKIDATSSERETGLWKFLKFAADAVRRLPEKKENILVFLEGYMNRSVANPIRPEDYLSTRNYSNGLESESGSPLERDEVGGVADQRINNLPVEPPTPAKGVKTAADAPKEQTPGAATTSEAPAPAPTKAVVVQPTREVTAPAPTKAVAEATEAVVVQPAREATAKPVLEAPTLGAPIPAPELKILAEPSRLGEDLPTAAEAPADAPKTPVPPGATQTATTTESTAKPAAPATNAPAATAPTPSPN